MHSFLAVDFICLNFRTVKMLLNFLKANHIMVDVFADLKLRVEAMSRHTVPTEADIAIYAEDILLIFAKVMMNPTGTEEFAKQKGIKPICSVFLYTDFAASHFFNLLMDWI